MRRRPATVYLGIGSNLGDRESHLARAMDLLARGVKIERTSSLYLTEPVGGPPQPPYLNAVCRGRTRLGPEDLLGMAKGIEAELGRKPGPRNAPRPIDIDILFYGDSVIDLPHLVIPHPGVPHRAFVLVPLAEIAPGLVHPASGRTAAEMAQGLRDRQGVRAWAREARHV